MAGLGLENESLISTMRVVRMPAALRLANALVHVVPRDGVMHNLNVRLPWFRSGQEPALRQLFSAGAVAVARTRVEPGRPGRPHRPGGPRPAAAALVAVVDLRVVVREPDGVVLPDLPVAATV